MGNICRGDGTIRRGCAFAVRRKSLHHHSVVPLPLGKGGFSAPYSVFCVGDGIYDVPLLYK